MKRAAPPLLWMGVIFVVSTDLGATARTSAFLGPMLHFLFPGMPEPRVRWLIVALRKSAHLTEYAILALLWMRSFRDAAWAIARRPEWAALLLASLYAGADELHQRFVPSRTGSLADVAIDTVGAALGLAVWKGGVRLRRSPGLTVKLKCFGWWFAWGVFSAIMVLTVTRGGALSPRMILLLILLTGIVAGSAGVAYYVRKH